MTIYDWFKPQSVRDIQIFSGFANFYRQFIQEFGKLVVPLTSMLKTTLVASQEEENLDQDGKKN